MLSKKLQDKLKKDGLNKWKFWNNLFIEECNYPKEISKNQREVISHNLALMVIWNDSHNIK